MRRAEYLEARGWIRTKAPDMARWARAPGPEDDYQYGIPEEEAELIQLDLDAAVRDHVDVLRPRAGGRPALVSGKDRWRRLEDEARAAAEAHGLPVQFLAKVRAILIATGKNDAVGVAAWLVGILDAVKFSSLRESFGDAVSGIVWAVTGSGSTHEQRLRSALGRIRGDLPDQGIPEAADLLLAWRAALVEVGGEGAAAAYRAEWRLVEAGIAGLGDDRLWERARRAHAVG